MARQYRHQDQDQDQLSLNQCHVQLQVQTSFKKQLNFGHFALIIHFD